MKSTGLSDDDAFLAYLASEKAVPMKTRQEINELVEKIGLVVSPADDPPDSPLLVAYHTLFWVLGIMKDNYLDEFFPEE